MKRYLKEKRGIYILSDPYFHESNEVFKDLKRRDLGNIEHHRPISENDLKKLYSGKTPVFDCTTPYGLQKKSMVRDYVISMQKRTRKHSFHDKRHFQNRDR